MAPDHVGQESQIVTSPLTGHPGGSRLDDNEAMGNQIVAHTLRGEGFDASEDGSNRGTPLVVDRRSHALTTRCGAAEEDGTGRGSPLVVDEVQITHPENRANPKPGDPAPTLAGTGRPMTYTIKGATIGRKPENGPQFGEILTDDTCYTLNTIDRHAVCEVEPNERLREAAERPGASETETAAYQCHGSDVGPTGVLRRGNGNEQGGVPFLVHGHQANPQVAAPITATNAATTPDTAGSCGTGPRNIVMAARPRRLTPVECERLQGLLDSWTQYRANGQEPAASGGADEVARFTQIADGPRYRMIGNGAAVPVLEWIGQRLARAL